MLLLNVGQSNLFDLLSSSQLAGKRVVLGKELAALKDPINAVRGVNDD
ncbi:hypothetical protein [Hydrogenophaga crocea]|uniref:Uncharacterized protein n=1 Tax=Hydrogenophaga crocea TaxID=2716225 RepID=A0A6G8IEN5_9BURK|nr:hypothetical protein [Hydrogenophaga crocea]QIM51603.1 hypothetical protein G9Q37_05345 [Hydrogenophaga crocea]